jgi:AcrR family transcriptional regulator
MRRGAETREALLDAALQVMSERGFHATSVPELAARAGIGAATMYRHFESKEALANALYVHAKRRFAELVLDGFPEGLPVRKAFQELWARLTRIVVKHTSLLVFLELHHHASYITPETLAACEDLVAKPILTLLRRGQQEGVVRAGDPGYLYTFLEGTFFGLAKAAVGRGGPVDEELMRKGEPLLWAAVRA